MTRRDGSLRPRLLAVEVVQTSAMDCGPAALKCLLEGFGIPVSYGRLREACQTEVDGTSIDTIEAIANALGLNARQMMLPLDQALAPGAVLPCLITVRPSAGPPHFVIVWSRIGRLLQVMDPAAGRRWVTVDRFRAEIYRHTCRVPAADWRDWAGGSDNLHFVRRQLTALGATHRQGEALIGRALADPGWFGLATLEAAIRQVAALALVTGRRQAASMQLLATLFETTLATPHAPDRLIPFDYWSVRAAAPETPDDAAAHLWLSGAVLVQFSGPVGRATASAPVGTGDASGFPPPTAAGAPLPADLQRALDERPVSTLATLWALAGTHRVASTLAILTALTLGAMAVLIEALLFRAIFDMAALLGLGSQRILAVVGLVGFLTLALALRWPIATEIMRLGRRLELSLRMAFLARLPALDDRYFQSRAISDMAERAHQLHLVRNLPAVMLQAVQTLFELALTLAGLAFIDPVTAGFGIAVLLVAMVLPLAVTSAATEADLRVHAHGTALTAVHLDALAGSVPIRAHRAEAAMARRHEALLVDWSRAMRRMAMLGLVTDALQQWLCLGLASLILLAHFAAVGAVHGGDLLLVFWTLKLPAIGHAFVAQLQHYPMHRNGLDRMLEPLGAAAGPVGAPPDARSHVQPRPRPGPMAITIRNGTLTASGHTLLSGLDLTIRAGEHVAIVGASGAGKSSLLGLLLGWHRLSEGELTLAGIRLDAADLAGLRARIAWVDPAVQLWNRSFLENLLFSSARPEAREAGRALAAANLKPVLRSLPDGFRSPLGEGGASLSGGEGQRVRFGRALMQQDADLVLLDEPFRGTDRAQRRRLLGAARSAWPAATLLCVSHDIEETLAFDRVLVMAAGRVIEDGAPAGLVRAGTHYHALLQAEQEARASTWSGFQWRHLRVEGGHVIGGG